MSATKFAVLAAAAVCTLSLTACSSEEKSGASPAPSASPSDEASSPAATGAEFGAGCAAVPTESSNPGSFDAMSKVPVATAASGNPVLKTLVAAVTKANLGDSLNTAPAITVFAPTNDAFGKIPKADLDKVLADNKTLTSILTYHVVPQKLSPDQLAGSHKTLQGGTVEVSGSGTNFSVNDTSQVICGNVQTANATVYIVDTVLMPTS